MAKLSDGTTILDRSVTQHNILSASKLYKNIGVDQFGIFLGLSGEKAQEVAAAMIEEKRLSASIDQVVYVYGCIYQQYISSSVCAVTF